VFLGLFVLVDYGETIGEVFKSALYSFFDDIVNIVDNLEVNEVNDDESAKEN
jgi:hypothetical protein